MVTGSEGFDRPTTFSATILKWYVVAGWRFTTLISVLSPVASTFETSVSQVPSVRITNNSKILSKNYLIL